MATASHMFPFMLTLPDGTLHDAVRIYRETLEAVAEWCGGEVGGAAIPGKGTVAGILYPTQVKAMMRSRPLAPTSCEDPSLSST